MLSTSPEKPSKMKQQDKFYLGLLSEQNSAANPSFRVYYGMASGSVPFVWESQPGTPKSTTSCSDIPPLTPPPSYYYNSNSKRSKKSSKFSFINTILPKLTLRKARTPSSPPSSSLSLSSSSESSSLSSFSPMASTRSCPRARLLSPRSLFADDEENGDKSPTLTLCFGKRPEA